MKNTWFIIPLAVVASACTAFTQEPTPTPATTPDSLQEWHGRGHHMFGVWKSLSPEEREKLKAASKAAKDDPAVAQARTKLIEQAKAFHDARAAAMLKADPSLAPVLEKLKEARKEKWQKRH